MRIDLHLGQLRSFVAVAEELHFGRAARRLHVSQPALSHQVRKLEGRLGVRLFDRTSRAVALTEAGRALLDDARRVLTAAEEALATAGRHRASAGEVLAIGFTGSAASRVLPAILERFRAEAPEVEISLRELTAERYDLLRSGELDLILGRLQAGEMPDLRVVVLEEEPRVAALPSGHALAERSEIALAELASDGFITQPESLNPAFRRAWLEEQRLHGLPARIAAEASSVQEFLNLVAAGQGICLVPETASRFNPWPGVVYVSLSDAAPATLSLAALTSAKRSVALIFEIADVRTPRAAP